ncbi:sugar phosphate isomerase/epimerase [Mycolicibacterium sp. P9-64]|uniref:sugar phosphate isomerase/epimerase family protein n=1 Tax=Mycolicibacterium sp. P9-64 TaxID=2024612 RepID=UPI0011EDDAF2|nr:sugar phosphate isomerase/epimerase [Mycolicibacterium sp. P9-64]KAA0084649.1 sugar phosphate isomerase/epimerase [Mycolicibacterium sp. P9-64]
MSLDLRWSTDLVTFFNPTYWDLPAELPYDAWEKEVDNDPERFFRRMLDGAAAAELSGIELAPAPGGWVNALRAYGSAAAFKRELSDRGLVLSSSYVLPVLLKAVLDADDPASRRHAEQALDAEVADHAAFLREVGCVNLVTSTIPRAEFSDFEGVDARSADFDAPTDPDLLGAVAEQLNRIGAVAADADVHVAIHTDAYSLASRTSDIDVLMAQTDPARVKLCIDAGHIALDGGDPLGVVRAHSHRAPVLHWKDCASHLPPHTLSGPPMVRHDVMIKYFRVMGSEGVVDWHEWVKILRDNQWSGWGVVEIDMSVDPHSEIRSGIEYYDRKLVVP